MRRIGHDRKLMRARELCHCRLVEIEDDRVCAADDEKRRRLHLGEPVSGEVRAAAPGDHSGDLVTQLGGREERSGCSGARAEILLPENSALGVV